MTNTTVETPTISPTPDEPHPGVAGTPDQIMQIGVGFWASKTLLSAVELDIFTALGSSALDGDALSARVGLHRRAAADFLDALVALGLLDRDDRPEHPTYRNTPDTAAFLDRTQPTYVGGILEMANSRLYGYWGRLTTALRTGRPQNEVVDTGRSLWESLAADEPRLAEFVRAMAGIQQGNFHLLAERLDVTQYRTVTDVGGAGADLALILARRHPHLQCISLDTPAVSRIAEANIRRAGLQHRVTAAAADMFDGAWPAADVVTMCNVLHDWNLDEKRYLVDAAFDALHEGGALVIVENLIDDGRRTSPFGLLMSLNMLIETDGGFDVTAAQLNSWTTAAGFDAFEVTPMAGPAVAAVATKGTASIPWTGRR